MEDEEITVGGTISGETFFCTPLGYPCQNMGQTTNGGLEGTLIRLMPPDGLPIHLVFRKHVPASVRWSIRDLQQRFNA